MRTLDIGHRSLPLPAILLVTISLICELRAQTPPAPEAPFAATTPVPAQKTDGRNGPSATSTPPPTPPPVVPIPAATPGVMISSGGDYVLAPNDVVEMRIIGEERLTTQATIARDGTVQLPLIKNDVKIAGLTVRAARQRITNLYSGDYLVNPQVFLNIAKFGERKFTILGRLPAREAIIWKVERHWSCSRRLAWLADSPASPIKVKSR